MTALHGFTWLLLCPSAGEVLARLALPGPVLSLLLPSTRTGSAVTSRLTDAQQRPRNL